MNMGSNPIVNPKSVSSRRACKGFTVPKTILNTRHISVCKAYTTQLPVTKAIGSAAKAYANPQ